MPSPDHDRLARLGTRGLTLEERTAGQGLVELRMRSRATDRLGFPVSAWLVDEVLVDTGFAHVGPLLLEALAGRTIRAVVLTHHHEDHAGNAGAIADRWGCAVYLRQPAERDSEGVGSLARYRRLFWGRPAPYEPLPLPPQLDTGGRTLRSLPTGGHSRTHSAFFDPDEGLVFTGDLIISRGASAVMRHEDPYELLASLRAVEALQPRRLLTGHGGDITEPGPALRHKIEQIEAAIATVLALHDQGVGEGAIRRRVFPRGGLGDLGGAVLTEGEFSRANFVRAVIRLRG